MQITIFFCLFERSLSKISLFLLKTNKSTFDIDKNFKCDIILEKKGRFYMEKNNKITQENEIAREIPLYKKENLTREEAYQLDYECVLIDNLLKEPKYKNIMTEQNLSTKNIPAYSLRIEALRRYLVSTIETEDPRYVVNKFNSESKAYCLSKAIGNSMKQDSENLRSEVEDSLIRSVGGKK